MIIIQMAKRFFKRFLFFAHAKNSRVNFFSLFFDILKETFTIFSYFCFCCWLHVFIAAAAAQQQPIG